MATAPTLPFVSVEDYLKSNHEPPCEYVDGTLIPKSVPDYIHSRLQKLLLLQLAAQEEKYGIEVCPELHIRINPTRFRIPDLCGLTEAPKDGRYPTTPPLFTIEIVSLEEPWPVVRAKVTDHLKMGVAMVIIADPYNKTVMTVRPGTSLAEVAPPLIVDVQVPEAGVLQIDFDLLYRKLTAV